MSRAGVSGISDVLDAWFIVHLASIMRFYMPKLGIRIAGNKRRDPGGPSLNTIARLIVLFLVCADIAEVRDN